LQHNKTSCEPAQLRVFDFVSILLLWWKFAQSYGIALFFGRMAKLLAWGL